MIKKRIIKLSVLLVVITMLVNCSKEEMRYIDPMISGINDQVEMTAVGLAAGSWNVALVGLKEQRVKLIGIKQRIDADGYKGDNYSLEDPVISAQLITESIAKMEFRIDSIWNANIGSEYDAINANSAGVVNFGGTAYTSTGQDLADVYEWLFLEVMDAEGEEQYIANDFGALQDAVAVLTGLAALNDNEVLEYVSNLKSKFAEMKQQYADLASEVASSPYFSKAQKELYPTIQGPLTDMETTINGQITLSTQDELNLIDRDLSGLVYFVANNYTSPAQTPLVFGEISSITELRWLSEVATKSELDGDWVLTADIDAAETARWNQDDEQGRFGFRPIITETSINFDGQFHIISGLHMTKVGGAGDEERSGMFSKLVNGSVKHLGLINLTVDATNGDNGNQGGTLVGWISGSGSVTKCFVQGQFIKAGSQTGGFIGRPHGMTGEISDCFSVVATSKPVNAATSSFIGLPVAGVNLYNCYNLGAADTNVRAIFGHGSGIVLNASGIYYDSETVGTTVIEHHTTPYSAATPTRLTDDGVVTDVPTANWNDLSNFPGFSADTWEIRTETQFDDNPRPYLKGFNYDGIADFIVPE